MMLAGSGGVDVFVKMVGEPRHVVSALNLATGKALIVTRFQDGILATACIGNNKHDIIRKCT